MTNLPPTSVTEETGVPKSLMKILRVPVANSNVTAIAFQLSRSSGLLVVLRTSLSALNSSLRAGHYNIYYYCVTINIITKGIFPSEIKVHDNS